MIDKLDIRKKIRDNILELHLNGRIDAYWANYLSDFIDEEIRAGQYYISLNLKHVNYISSAGVRILVKFYKQLKGIHGTFTITELSENVKSVLEMVGLTEMFTKPAKIDFVDKKEQEKEFEINKTKYTCSELNKETSVKCKILGNPELLKDSGFSEQDIQNEVFFENKFGIGLGAIGTGFEDCKNRFGEFIGLSNAVAYMPTDGTNKPDYIIKTGKLLPEIKLLYGLIFDGKFNDLIRFNTVDKNLSVAFSEIIDAINQITEYETFLMVMIAEISGIVGASINRSPMDNSKGSSPFQFPDIRNKINYTTEPEFNKMLSITIGIASNKIDKNLKAFTRQLSTGKEIYGHFHSAIFYYHPIKKENIDLSKTIRSLFEVDKIQNIIHLINDNREIIGVGESEFINGTCWIGKVSELIKDN